MISGRLFRLCTLSIENQNKNGKNLSPKVRAKRLSRLKFLSKFSLHQGTTFTTLVAVGALPEELVGELINSNVL
ncbi:MAG: hypothetical protein G3M70_05750 [Candidatus Nitronauta litoralis]|uniref:Uncharacterized protein n=1 Tax=Candidatus Nitronauta litoralis TaxID=2705533 RepID=A0A7T0BV52_9BACT|nr:MAG: hypothetical protein G3M70_05750 [Candidatus Nitronauta litoralis]